jgi:hypothetical protein
MKEKIEYLLKITHNELLFKKIRDEYIKSIKETLEDDPEMFEDMMSFIIKEFKYEDFKERTVENYLTTYTEEELDYMLEYYTCDLGKSILSKNEIMVSKAWKLGQDIGNDLISKIQKMFD